MENEKPKLSEQLEARVSYKDYTIADNFPASILEEDKYIPNQEKELRDRLKNDSDFAIKHYDLIKRIIKNTNPSFEELSERSYIENKYVFQLCKVSQKYYDLTGKISPYFSKCLVAYGNIIRAIDEKMEEIKNEKK